MEDHTIYLQLLKSCELFKDLSDLELNNLYASMVKVKVQPGEVILTQGEISDCMYVLLRGRLLVKQADGKVIAQIGRGQTVGEMGVITNEPRSATVVAMRESLLLKLDQTRFTELWTRHPSLLFEVTKILTQRLRKTLKPPKRYNNNSNTIVMQANQQTDIKLFMEKFAASFDRRFRYKILRRSDFPISYSEEQLHQQIQDLEIHHDFLFYEVGFHEEEWRDICLGYADRVLLLADGSQTVSYDPEIISLFTGCSVNPEIKKILVLLYDPSATPQNTQSWLDPIPFFRYYHVHLHQEGDFSRLLRLLNGTAIGLVLGGGGTRNWAQVGVMKYIFEQGIPIDAFAGTSSGTISAASLAFVKNFSEYLALGTEFRNRISFKEYTIPYASVLSSRSLTKALKDLFGEKKIEDLEKQLICVAADLFSSKEVDIQEGLLWKGVRASVSIPGVYPPVYNSSSSQLLVDGAVLNNLPVDVMRNYFEGFGKIIAVDISGTGTIVANYDYPLELTWTTILKKKILSRANQLVFPSVMNTLYRGLLLGSEQKAKINGSLSNIHIKPNLEGFPLLDFSRYNELIAIGYAAAEKALANWRVDLEFL